MFGGKKPAQQSVTNGRFELEEAGQVAWLEYNLGDGVLQLIHTEVPPALRGKGIAGELARSALELARERGLKVDVICPSVTEYVNKHPEYADLVLR
jgi:predicted GNAT family acetyltransferase